MTVAIIPAAGASRRMGRPKLLLPFRGTTLLGSLVGTLRAAGIGRIVVVRRGDDDELGGWLEGTKLDQTVNPEPEGGMLTSIWRGLDALGGAAELAAGSGELVVSPADYPAVRPETVRRLLAELRRRHAGLALPVFGGRRGHPVVVASDLVGAVADLDPAVGLRQLRRRYPERVAAVEVDDPGVTLDVDRPADYERLLAET